MKQRFQGQAALRERGAQSKGLPTDQGEGLEAVCVANNHIKPKDKVLSPVIFSRKPNNGGKHVRVSKRMQVFESLLQLVVQTYYRGDVEVERLVSAAPRRRDRSSNARPSRSRPSQKNQASISTAVSDESSRSRVISARHMLDYLVSPLKTDYEFELWTVKEIAIFEASLCLFGKQFDLIEAHVGTKSLEQIIRFYNLWKLSTHYKIWKANLRALSKKEPRLWH